jgi:hypothetical protein
MLKRNVVGGASIIFNRYAEVGKTKIKRVHYTDDSEWKQDEDGKPVENVVGFDANALYLWCLSQNMPCGEMKYEEIDETILDGVYDGSWFGFVECDIYTPEHLYDYFGEFPPIFKNVELKEEHLGKYMKDLRAKLNKPMPAGGQRKLISSFKGTKILLYTPLLKWYMEKGLIVTKVYSGIKAVPNALFKGFCNKVSDARRDGDKDQNKEIIAECMKLVGNSAFGRTGMNKNKHSSTCYEENISKARKKVLNAKFIDLNEISSDDSTMYEIRSSKATIRQNIPIQVASAVYQLAKLRMLEFYYDYVDKFISREDFQYIEMDTDSAYMSLSAKNFDDLIKPNMRNLYEEVKYDWILDNRSEESKSYTRRVPGLFKIEWEGTGIVALTSKMYYCYGSKEKSSCKGVQSRNNKNLLTFEKYKEALGGCVLNATNKGFRVFDNKVITYTQDKDGLTPIYDKRVLFEDGINSYPLMI